jgi:amino acid permease
MHLQEKPGTNPDLIKMKEIYFNYITKGEIKLTTLLNGFKSLVLRPKLIKIIFLIIIIVFMFNVYNILQTEKNPGYYFAFYLAIPIYLYVLGLISNEKPVHQKNSVKENTMPSIQSNQDLYEDDFNNNQIETIDKMEKRIIKTYRKESVETIYFSNGKTYREQKTNYFNEGDF